MGRVAKGRKGRGREEKEGTRRNQPLVSAYTPDKADVKSWKNTDIVAAQMLTVARGRLLLFQKMVTSAASFRYFIL